MTRRRTGLVALLALAFAFATIMQAIGWAQTSYYALVKALGNGTAQIDSYQWETHDKSYTDGHFYSVKAPGLAFATFPAYEALSAAGGRKASRDIALNTRETGDSRWAYRGLLVFSYGYDRFRAKRTRDDVEGSAPMIWALGLFGSVIPAFGLLLLVRWCGDRVAPGRGTLAAVILGTGTLILPFATEYFGHILAALLAFGAFALLWRERDGPPRLWMLAVAGLLSGLAVFTEYPLAVSGAIVGVYALTRWSGPATAAVRGAAYSVGVFAGLAPLFAYNLWAYGKADHLSYADAVKNQGYDGHAVLGLNDGGVYGVHLPKPEVALQLLFTSRGILVLSPVLVAGAIGTWLLWREGKRAEAGVITAMVVGYMAYVSGYWLPFGGGTPGPRFLTPVLPFLAVGLAPALRRFPTLTLSLALPSILTMVTAVATYPLIGDDNVGLWWDRAMNGIYANTVLKPLGVTGVVSIMPFVLAIGLAIVLALRATPGLGRIDLRVAVPAVAAWAVVALAGPALLLDKTAPQNTPNGSSSETKLILSIAALSLVVLAIGAAFAWWRARERGASLQGVDHDPAPDLAG